MASGNTWWTEDGSEDDGDERAPSSRLGELDIEDTLPEPIYIKNNGLAEMRRYLSRITEDDVFSGDEEENEEGNLDLTAPPLES